MTVEQVAKVLHLFGGIFVGGAAMAWKLSTAPAWIELAHARGYDATSAGLARWSVSHWRARWAPIASSIPNSGYSILS